MKNIFVKKERNLKDSINVGLAWFAFFITCNSLMMLIAILLAEGGSHFKLFSGTAAMWPFVGLGVILGVIDSILVYWYLPKTLAVVHGTSFGEEFSAMILLFIIPVIVIALTDFFF